MPSKKNRIILIIRLHAIFRLLFSIAAFSIIFSSIPGLSNKNTFAQSTYLEKSHIEQNILKRQEKKITTKPQPDFTEPMRIDNQSIRTSSGGNDLSIKSTDAGIRPRIQMNSECPNCNVFNYGQNGAANFIPDWIINSVIQSKIFKREAHRHHTNDVDMEQISDSYRHFNNSD